MAAASRGAYRELVEADSPLTPTALLELDLGRLVGLPVAAAAHEIERAGGQLRAVAPGQAVTLDYRPDRVTLTVRDGIVTAEHGIG